MSALNENQYQVFAERLHARRNELIEDIMVQIRENESQLAEYLDTQLDHLDDDAVAHELVELNLDYVEGETGKLRGVQDAEQRMKEGTYGICIDCGRDINPDKLQLQPSSTRCSECEALHERTVGSSNDKRYH